MYSILAGFDTMPEMRDAVNVIKWLHANLHTLIDARIKPAALAAIRAAGKEAGGEQAAGEETVVSQPDWSRLVLAGHSRGGKVTFGILRKLVGEFVKSTKQQRGFIKAELPVPIKAAILFDPVDGTASSATNPPTLTHQPDSIFLLNNPPVLVIGSGLGPIPRGSKSPSDKGNPCAPANFGHKVFFSDLVGPAYHFSVPEFGHADFYDDDLGPIYGPLFSKVCTNGPAREPMRVAAGGLAVAFLEAVVGGGGYGEKGESVRRMKNERSGMEVERRDRGSVGEAARSFEEKQQALERLVTDAAADVVGVASGTVLLSDQGQGTEQKQQEGLEQQKQEEERQELVDLERERQRLEEVYMRSGGSGGACEVDSKEGNGSGSAKGNRVGGCGAVIGSGKGSDVSNLCDLLQHPEHSPVVLSEVGWKVGRQQETPEEIPAGAPTTLCGPAPATVAAAAAL
ncbi:unnamed protein product [Closterium sp. NIES-53]